MQYFFTIFRIIFRIIQIIIIDKKLNRIDFQYNKFLIYCLYIETITLEKKRVKLY